MHVKCRVQREGTLGERQLSPLRSFTFDRALVILFGPGYEVQEAVMLAQLMEAVARDPETGRVERMAPAEVWRDMPGRACLVLMGYEYTRRARAGALLNYVAAKPKHPSVSERIARSRRRASESGAEEPR